jgi:hypothetical protein
VTLPSWVKAVLLLGLVFGVAFVVGVDLVHCLLLAVGTLVVVQLRRLPQADDDAWPVREADPSDRGVRLEVARLSWGLHGFESRVDRRSVDRLYVIAARRLHARGVDLEDPADADQAQRLLGSAPYAALTGDPNNPPRYVDFARAVTAVERLPTSTSTERTP